MPLKTEKRGRMRVIGKTLEEEVEYTRRLFERMKRWSEVYKHPPAKKRGFAIRLLDRLCVLEKILTGE